MAQINGPCESNNKQGETATGPGTNENEPYQLDGYHVTPGKNATGITQQHYLALAWTHMEQRWEYAAALSMTVACQQRACDWAAQPRHHLTLRLQLRQLRQCQIGQLVTLVGATTTHDCYCHHCHWLQRAGAMVSGLPVLPCPLPVGVAPGKS